MKKDFKLYNIIFPIWMLMMIPPLWLAILPANFIIDSLVILITMAVIGIYPKWEMYRKTILKVWIFGFLSDIIGTAVIFLLSMIINEGFDDSPEFIIPGLVVAAILIFVFNYFVSFKKYDKGTRFKMALSLMIFTTPYTFLIPTSWVY